ncbi:hypothetical protein, partial [Escherichia marmotae]|uniref:hypothetical protein n=2 Tax=Enterobacteriaceae TaxID=543 RepID=UPI00215B4F30
GMGAPGVGCGVNALSDLDSRRPDKTQSVASGMGAPGVGCGVNALSDLDSRRPDKTRSVASGMVRRMSDAA